MIHTLHQSEFIRREGSFRHTWADVSLGAIRHNVRAFQALLADRCLLMAVVKADGYGHGSVQTASAALAAGAGYLAVAFAGEAFALRDAGIQAPILILGYTPPEFASEAVAQEAAVTFFDRETLQAVIDSAARSGKQARVHLKIDTGMTRLGVRTAEEALELAQIAADSPHVELEGVFTHFADADRSGSDYTEQQFARFMQIVRHLESKGIRIPLRHCCNTAGTICYPHMHLDMVRIGIGLYGLNPCRDHSPQALPLQKAMRLNSRIAALKRIPAGQPVSYGCTYQADSEQLLAVLPIGYADGLPRLLSNIGSVLIHGCKARIVGNVCMDQTIVNVTDIPHVTIGDEAILLGDGENGSAISADDIAALTGTIGYEVLCDISRRVPRRYEPNL